MKVLMIITVDLGKNGISTCVLNYWDVLKDMGIETDVLAPNQVDEEIKRRFAKNGSILYELTFRNSEPWKYFLKLRQIIKKGNYDIIHVHGNSATMAVELTAAFLAGCRVRIAHSHNTTCQHMKAHRLLLPLFNRMYTHGAACGREAGKWLFGTKDFLVLPNGIRIEEYKYSEEAGRDYREAKGISSDTILIGHIGLFNYQKNQEFLVRVFAGLLKQSHDYMLLLAGDGELKERTENLVSHLKIEDHVIFTGNEEDVPACLSAMDLFVLPSRFEGLPYVLVEAQAAALPCIVSSSVTKEADLTGLLRFVDGFCEEEWIKAITEQKKGHAVEKYACIQGELRRKGYDIRHNGGMLADFYEKCILGQ